MPRKFSRISKQKRNKILACFAEDLTATQTARLVGIQRKTANDWYGTIRERIAAYQDEQNASFTGEVELDESCFGGPRRKLHAEDRRKRGRGAENKVPVFGIKKRSDGGVYVEIVRNASKQSLLPIIRRLVAKDESIIDTDKWRSYDGLVLDGYKHRRINHSKTYSNRKGTHINGIENFWSYAKRRLSKFNGVSRKTFRLHLKECEFRYNNKGDIVRVLREIMRDLLL